MQFFSGLFLALSALAAPCVLPGVAPVIPAAAALPYAGLGLNGLAAAGLPYAGFGLGYPGIAAAAGLPFAGLGLGYPGIAAAAALPYGDLGLGADYRFGGINNDIF